MRTTKKWFCLSAGLILSITGAAKVWSAFGNAEILNKVDPILNIQFGRLILVAGILELAVAALFLLSKRKTDTTIVVAWLASVLLAYRLGLWWIGWHRPCSCLGNFTDAIHISPQVADNVVKGVLAYLLIGSYGILSQGWWVKTKLGTGSSQFETQRSDAGVGS